MNAASSLQNPRVQLAHARVDSVASRHAWWASCVLIAAAWLLIFNQQRLEWSVNPTYAYGWAVPILAGYLLAERWRTRPAARATPNSAAWLLLPMLLVLAYLPVRVVQEANPDWVKINWIMAALVIGLSGFALFSAAGWRAALHCAFPVLFCLTALPWPVWIEDNVTKSLMHWNASAGAELLTLLGHPAMAKGNLIQIGASWVNVEEACSGIRSLQTAFMASLFFGEFYRMGWLARTGLTLSSFAMAFALNFARTVALTYLGGVGGNALTEKWHDPIGNVAMVACLLALWLLAEAFRRRETPNADTSALRPPSLPAPARPPFPFWFALAGLGWLAASEEATAGWYAYHERLAPAPPAWEVRWPEAMPEFRRDTLSERSRALLKYNEGQIASWRTAEGYRWQMYYLRWLPGRVSKFLAAGHYPTVCLPANGLRLVTETGTFVCHVGHLTLPFTTYLFDDGGRDVFVFHAILQDGQVNDEKGAAYRQANSMDRLRSVLRGERNLGERVVGVAVRGPIDATEAREVFQATLRQIIATAP